MSRVSPDKDGLKSHSGVIAKLGIDLRLLFNISRPQFIQQTRTVIVLFLKIIMEIKVDVL